MITEGRTHPGAGVVSVCSRCNRFDECARSKNLCALGRVIPSRVDVLVSRVSDMPGARRLSEGVSALTLADSAPADGPAAADRGVVAAYVIVHRGRDYGSARRGHVFPP